MDRIGIDILGDLYGLVEIPFRLIAQAGNGGTSKSLFHANIDAAHRQRGLRQHLFQFAAIGSARFVVKLDGVEPVDRSLPDPVQERQVGPQISRVRRKLVSLRLPKFHGINTSRTVAASSRRSIAALSSSKPIVRDSRRSTGSFPSRNSAMKRGMSRLGTQLPI